LEYIVFNLPENITTGKIMEAFEKTGNQMKTIKTGEWRTETVAGEKETKSEISHSDIIFNLSLKNGSKNQKIRVQVSPLSEAETASLIQFFRVFMTVHCAS